MSERRHVLFVAGPAPLGGSNRSLVTLLEGLDGRVTRVLAAPDGAFVDMVRDRGGADVHVRLPRPGRLRQTALVRRLFQVAASARIALAALRHRKELLAIHANATTGLNLALPAAVLSRTPVTCWVHDPTGSDWGRRLGRVWRRVLPRVSYAAVSVTARDVAVDHGLCEPDDVVIVPNPIDPADVVAAPHRPGERLVVGYLSPPTWRKGFDLLPEVIGELADLPLDWKLFSNRNPSDYNRPVWDALDAMGQVSQEESHDDVRRVYEQCDLVLVPSRQESFSRITAEAILNGIPVVATDLPPMRFMLETGAGGLFPPDDAAGAASEVRRLCLDAALRRAAGEEGARRGREFTPELVVERMVDLYEAGHRPLRDGAPQARSRRGHH